MYWMQCGCYTLRSNWSTGMESVPVVGCRDMGWIPEPRVLLGVLIVLLDLTRGGSNRPVPTTYPENSLHSPSHSDTCQHTVWDDSVGPKGVQVVYGTCSEGSVDWRYPYGSVRLILQPDYRHTDFEACFIARSHFVMAKISLENGKQQTEEEDKYDDSRLKQLVLLNRTNPQTDREVCLKSYGDPVTLYLEVNPDISAATIGHIEIQYDLQRTFTHYSYDDMEECRPCTEAEILREVCTNDFVVYGTMGAVFHHDEQGETQIQVNPAKIIRQRVPLFNSTKYIVPPGVGKETDSHLLVDIAQEHFHSSVFSPRKCGIKQDLAEYLFMGRIRLGKALLKCAPRFKDFQKMWKQAVERGENWCVLDSQKS